MDHIPTPQQPLYGPADIPCLVRQSFSPSRSPDFHDYPESLGWQSRSLINSDFRQNHTEEESRQFLQEWLYFKLMAETFGAVGIEVDMDDFTRRKADQLLVDSTNLVRYISEFERQFREMTDHPEQQIACVQKISDALRTAQRICVQQCSMTSPLSVRSHTWPFDSAISLSFMILGCTLTFAVSRIIQVLPDKTHALEIYKKLHISHESWGISELLYQRMRNNNWCPHSLAQFASGESSIIGMYYASLLAIPEDGKDHKNCKVRSCLHRTVDNKTYQTHHTHPLPRCKPIVPKREKIIECLHSERVPLLRTKTEQNGGIEVEVIPYRKGVSYVAISHVWAHGMGNLEGNWLPNCQMQRLSKLVAALYPFSSAQKEVYFWIDTIGVPLKQETDDKDYRKVAIDLLKKTYQDADKVLVLDMQLMQTSSGATPEEMLVRILSAGWMTRLWTLQEGLLASKLRFQFKERALDAEDLLSDIMPIHHSSVWRETYEFFSSLRVLKMTPPPNKLRYLWNYFQWRSVSHPSDETICLSILTGKQPSVVLSIPPAERMRKFLEQINGFPSDIIFMPGPRIDEDGWKWAPTSFMARYQWTAYEQFQQTVLPGASDHTISNQTNISQRFEEGLRVHFPGLALSEVPSDLDMTFQVEETHMKTKMRFQVVYLYDKCPPEWKDIDLKSLKHPTIILQAYPDDYGTIHAIIVDAYKEPGLMGEVPFDRTAGIVNPVRFICRASVAFVDSTSQDSEEVQHKFQENQQVSCKCKGRLLDQQWWYVG